MFTIANTGVPMLFVYGPVFAVGFIPIVLVETGWISWRGRAGFGRALWPVTLANLVSTIAGVPLTWIALVILQMLTGGGGAHGAGVLSVTWQAAWLIPYEGELHWMIPAAGLVLCVPFYIASALIEAKVLKRSFRTIERATRLVWSANLVSYGLLAAFWVYVLMTSLE